MDTDVRRRKYWLIGVGIAIALIGTSAPFFNWYVLMRATCPPSDDLCGMENILLFMFVSIPCLLLGTILFLIGLILTDRPRARLYWPAILSLVFGLLAGAARFTLDSKLVVGGNLWTILLLTSIISSLLALIIAIVATIATLMLELGWLKGRLLSCIALVMGAILTLLFIFRGFSL